MNNGIITGLSLSGLVLSFPLLANSPTVAPLADYLEPPYSSFMLGEPTKVDDPQIEIPSLSAGQSVVFYRTRKGDVKSSFCSTVKIQDVVQPQQQKIMPLFKLASQVESDKADYVISKYAVDTQLNTTHSTGVMSGFKDSDNVSSAIDQQLARTDKTTDNLNTSTHSANSLSKATRSHDIGSEEDKGSLSKSKGENILSSEQATAANLSKSKGFSNNSSVTNAQRARMLSIRNQFSGLNDSDGIDALFEQEMGLFYLDESDDLDFQDYTDDELYIAEQVSVQFSTLMQRWGDLKLIDLLDDLASENLRVKSIPAVPEEYNVEVSCVVQAIEEEGKIYHGSLLGIRTDVINKGSPIYDVVVLSASPENTAYYDSPANQKHFSMFFKPNEKLILTRAHLPLRKGSGLRSQYAAKANAWDVKPPVEETSFFGF